MEWSTRLFGLKSRVSTLGGSEMLKMLDLRCVIHVSVCDCARVCCGLGMVWSLAALSTR